MNPAWWCSEVKRVEQLIAESERRSIHDVIMMARRAMKNVSVVAGGGVFEVCG